MTGYVIYACKCLNVNLQLDYEYLLDQHEHDRTSHFVQLANICGWRFKVIKATIKFEALIQSFLKEGWHTIHCYNCSSNVYSFKATFPERDITDVQNEYVVIHKESVFNEEVKQIQKKPNYSNIFQIVLNSDLHTDFTIEQQAETNELSKQKRNIEFILNQFTQTLEKEKEEKIREYIQEQTILLKRAKEKAKHESLILYQTIREVSHHHENPVTLDNHKAPPSLSIHPLSTAAVFNNPLKADQGQEDDEEEGMFAFDEDMNHTSSHNELKKNNSVPMIHFTRDNRFTAYDFTEAERALSSQFAPSRRKTIQHPGFYNGNVIPPHILAENTIVNEKEALFGSLPNQRRTSHCRPLID
ncbi:hypothetical protein G6F57_001459 [Rhizopus arrhizus]|uniref:Uncharacterized protein n=1 Tax=Rhizopus oryzae TaxID=64495 RepID=A0A9P6XD74_RHIOR|nr:hypothetical protein G6F23_001831 [Rhizopus arrhizus]KAG1412783.1 hypothetical protein G6F58_007843 [Rhizopus delemar]KAG0769355.1 hypothetical protein G6F24_001143 [Rhizopus arrhizus]KAG0797326.1 hypothetical protein G6F21_000613 [Rhizopus arrhizus]KAG0814059.1 hypothetical protein G6F20_005071 [Rhizopus arrhizus]